jgi:hypothetical protein
LAWLAAIVATDEVGTGAAILTEAVLADLTGQARRDADATSTSPAWAAIGVKRALPRGPALAVDTVFANRTLLAATAFVLDALASTAPSSVPAALVAASRTFDRFNLVGRERADAEGTEDGRECLSEASTRKWRGCAIAGKGDGEVIKAILIHAMTSLGLVRVGADDFFGRTLWGPSTL